MAALIDSFRRLVKRILLRPKRPGARPDDGELPDPREFVEFLDVLKKAKENGSHNIPPPDDRKWDGTQTEIIQVVENSNQVMKQEQEQRLLGFAELIDGCDLKRALTNLEESVRRSKQALAELVERHNREAEDLRVAAQDRREQLKSVRLEQDIKREPRVPLSRVASKVTAGVLALMEGFLNAWFFAQGSATGLLGGAVQALGFAGVDLLIVFNLGQSIRFLNSRKTMHRVTGALAWLLGASWILFYNLFVAHFRDQLQEDPLRASSRAVEVFVSDPSGLIDTNSWLLFALGAVFSTLGLVAGYKSDDPIPGYGNAHRGFLDARDELSDSVTDSLGQLTRLRDDATTEIDNIRSNAEVDVSRLRNAIESKITAVKRLHSFANTVENTANAVIRIYRDENQRHRSEPPPSYFQEEWEYPIPTAWTYDARSDREKLAKQEELLSTLKETESESRTGIAHYYERCRAQLDSAYVSMVSDDELPRWSQR